MPGSGCPVGVLHDGTILMPEPESRARDSSLAKSDKAVLGWAALAGGIAGLVVLMFGSIGLAGWIGEEGVTNPHVTIRTTAGVFYGSPTAGQWLAIALAMACVASVVVRARVAGRPDFSGGSAGNVIGRASGIGSIVVGLVTGLIRYQDVCLELVRLGKRGDVRDIGYSLLELTYAMWTTLGCVAVVGVGLILLPSLIGVGNSRSHVGTVKGE